jgi:hypothetical protein
MQIMLMNSPFFLCGPANVLSPVMCVLNVIELQSRKPCLTQSPRSMQFSTS